MRVPLQIDFDGLARSEEMVNEAEHLVRRLEDFCADLFACRVAVSEHVREFPPPSSYMVYLNVSLASEEGILAATYHGGDARSVMRCAFDSVKRELTEHQRGRIGRSSS